MKMILQHHRIPVLGAALVKIVAVAALAVDVDLTLAVVALRLVSAVDALVVAVVADRG